MRKLWLVGGFILIGAVLYVKFGYKDGEKGVRSVKNVVQKSVGTVVDLGGVKHKPSQSISGSIFVPYWTVGSLDLRDEAMFPSGIKHDSADYVVYFGISPKDSSIDTGEAGYASLARFAEKVGNSRESLLTLRMLNEDSNEAVLEDPQRQIGIIAEVFLLAQEYGFEGVVLDLEHSVLPTQKVTDEITDFITRMGTAARARDMKFAITLYGDVFYRARPYDVEKIASEIDYFYMMTYDFHKSYGSPGPNFPLKEGDKYGYSLERLVSDLFDAGVPPEKLVFILGMYGYDWSVDEEDRPLKAAEAVTLHQAKARFEGKAVQSDPTSSENTFSYTDDSNQRHVVWFENERSAQEKVTFLMSKGISKVGYWAWGYY